MASHLARSPETTESTPPSDAGRLRGAGDRTALVAAGLLAGGLVVGLDGLVVVGRLAALVGAVVDAHLIAGQLRQQRE